MKLERDTKILLTIIAIVLIVCLTQVYLKQMNFNQSKGKQQVSGMFAAAMIHSTHFEELLESVPIPQVNPSTPKRA
jgi:hypothetical protein